MKKVKHLVIGSKGEVGSAIFAILKARYGKIYEHDLSLIHPSEIKCDMIHICFYNKNDFIIDVMNYVDDFGIKDAIVVIHSTPLPFTTMNLSKVIKNVVYSPIRGNHPNLYPDILKYTKYLASDFEEAIEVVGQVFILAGMNIKIHPSATTLEFAKHYSTTMFGLSLVVTQEVFAAKKTYGIDPALIMDFINDTGKYTHDRKIYPYTEKIGGHCVIENAKMFRSFSEVANFVVKFDKLFAQQYPDKNYRLKEEKKLCPSCNQVMNIFNLQTCSICDYECCLMCFRKHNCLGEEES